MEEKKANDAVPAEDTQGGTNRRDFMRNAMLGGAGAALAGASLPLAVPVASAEEIGLGPPRKIMWVTHSIGEWNLFVDVGFRDFCAQAGWEYQKIGVPGAAYSVEANVNQIKLAIQAKPDVLIGTLSNAAVESVLAEAQEAGILVIINNSSIEEIRADHNWGFIGAGGYGQGLLSGRMIGNYLVARGRKDGVLIYGNPEPGHVVLEDRRRGTEDGLKEINAMHGSSFTLEEFADQAHDPAASIPLYSAQRSRLGDDLAGFAVAGYNSMISAYKMLEEAGVPPGEIPVGGMDTGPEINPGIETGYIIYGVEQELYNQGYLSSAIAWARLERLNIPPVVNTGTALVTRENLKMFDDRANIVLARAKELGMRQ